MAVESWQDPDFGKLVAEFSLTPIKDDQSYRLAIEILDRLFALDDRRTPGERSYFRALAANAYHYETAFQVV